jgi:6-phosphogluconolactonase/glucosamine-6-phosphate isomerase/deaminase
MRFGVEEKLSWKRWSKVFMDEYVFRKPSVDEGCMGKVQEVKMNK